MVTRKTFTVFFSPGPAWIAGKTSREQPCWTEHAAFMDKLFADGIVVLGGPYGDYSALLVVIEAANEDAARKLFEQDPFVINEIARLDAVHEWLIFLDSRRR